MHQNSLNMNKNRDKNTQDPPIEAANTAETCTLVRCIDDEDQNRLKCRNCQRMVHYECTQLPLYQLQIFVNTYNNQYVCHNCVRITRSLTSKIGDNTYHMMQKEIAKKDDEIKKLKNELTKNREVIKNDIENILTEKMTDLEKSVVSEQKEEERRETRDIESRKNNIIIHGLYEETENTKEEDKNQIEELLEVIDLSDIKPTRHHRIGAEVDENGRRKKRPIKVTFQSEGEKERMMNNLNKLKLFGYCLSITDDFTINERRKIKEMCEKAKKWNCEKCDGHFIWRVRGSPRTENLRLIKSRKNLLRIPSFNSSSSSSDDLPKEN